MKDKSESHSFDSAKEYCFQICHPSLSKMDQSLVEFTSDSTYPSAIKAGIAMVGESDLPWVKISHGDWSRTIDRKALWLTNSGKLISKRHSRFRESMHESQLLTAEPLLTKTSFGWSFYSYETAMDGMAFKYIGWHLNPMLHKYFETYKSFEYHLFNKAPDIPDWLDAEFFESEQAIAVYGEKLLSAVPDRTSSKEEPYDLADYMVKEMGIALRIQDAFGVEAANAWVQFHRSINFPDDDD